MGKISFKEKEKQRREQEILQTATRLLAERGFANLNMDDLADAVGISKPTLYQHFRSKEDLVVQVVVNNLSMMEQHLNEIVNGTPLERLQQMTRWRLKARYKPDNVFNALHDAEIPWVELHKHPILQEKRAMGQRKTAELVEEAKADGEIDLKLSTPIVVQMMFCLPGALGDPAIRQAIIQSEEALDQAVESVLKIFFRGIAPD